MPSTGVPAGIFSALSFGAGDFAGAVAARRAGALVVVAGAHGIGLIALLLAALVIQPPFPSLDGILIGLVAGVAGAVGLAALYRGMSLGSMGLVTALSGAGSLAIPLGVGALLGADASPIQLIGVCFAAAAAMAASGASRVSLAAALTGMYPVVTMLLARFVLGEHLPRLGQVGVALALIGVLLISIG